MPKLPEFNRLADALRNAGKTVAEGETYRAADVAALAAEMIEQFNAVGIEIVKEEPTPQRTEEQLTLPDVEPLPEEPAIKPKPKGGKKK